VFAYVVLRGQRPTGNTHDLVAELRTWVAEHLGAIARPDDIRFADNLPKTRSGKIMRRLLRAIARGEEITQDVSTLENPAILDQLRGVDAPAAPAKAKPAGAKPAVRKRVKAKSAHARPKAKAKTRRTKPTRKPAKSAGRRTVDKRVRKAATKARRKKPRAKR
jgi:hypothetical protein